MKSRPPLMLQEFSEVLRNPSGDLRLKNFLSQFAAAGSAQNLGASIFDVVDASVVVGTIGIADWLTALGCESSPINSQIPIPRLAATRMRPIPMEIAFFGC